MESDDHFTDQPEGSPEWKMPWSLLVCDHIAQVVVQHIDNLIIRDGSFVSTAYQSQSQFDLVVLVPLTKNI